MKCFWRRTVSIIICIAMILTLLPQSMLEKVSAAVNGGQSPEYRQEIIDALAGIVGGEEKAQDYYRMLQDYGLLDEDGNILNDWYIEKDGCQISLDEIREILAGDYDPQDVVWVDGAPVALEDLKTMIDIEDYLAYVKDTYFTEKVWTKEQTANAESLVEQLEREGILLRTASNDNAGHITGARDVSHDARVKVTLLENSIEQTEVVAITARFEVSLEGAVPGQQVSFKYKALSGSRSVTDSGVVKEKTLTAGADGTATGEIDVDAERVDPMADPSPVYAEKTYFVLDCFDVKNALFTDSEGADSEALGMLVECKGSTAPGTMPECISFNITGSTGVPDDAFFRPAGTFRTETVMVDVLDSNGQPTGERIGKPVNHLEEHDPELLKGNTVELSDGQQLLIKWGLVDDVAFDHPKDGTGIRYNTPQDQFGDRGVIFGYSGENTAMWGLENPQTTVEIHAANDPDGVSVQIPTDEVVVNVDRKTDGVGGVGTKTLDITSSRLIQPATWEFIVRKNGSSDDWYNYSRGYRPDGTNLSSWDKENLLPVGGQDLSRVSTGAAISKGDEITSITFDGGFAYYPLKIVTEEKKTGPLNTPDESLISAGKNISKIHTIQLGVPTNHSKWTMESSVIYNKVHRYEAYTNNQLTQTEWREWTPDYFAEFYPGVINDDPNKIQEFYAFYGTKFNITAQFSRSEAPKIESISVPACEFKSGELIPITVKYSEPAQATARMTVKGEVLAPVETSASNIQTFLFKVKENGSTSIIITAFDPKNLDGRAFSNIAEYVDNVYSSKTLKLEPAGFKIDNVVAKNTFTSFALKANNTNIAEPKLNVTVDVISDTNRTAWLAADFETVGTDHFSKSLRVRIVSTDNTYDSGYLRLKSVGDNITGGKLTTGDITISGNSSGATRYYIAELYLDNGTVLSENATTEQQNSKYDPVIGKYNGSLIGIGGDAVASVKFVTEADLTAEISVKKSNGTDDYEYNDSSNKVIYSEDKPVIKASFALAAGEYTYGNPRKVTYINSYGNPANSTADFAWVSSDTSVAVISADGRISPTGKAGETTISIIVYNGNAEGKKVTKEVGRLKFDSGNKPFFEVPDLAYDIVDGQGLTVFWSSNICAQNGTTPTVFTVKLYRANDSSGTPVYTTTVSGTKASPVSQAAIPAEYLAYTYEENGINEFVIKVSTQYHDITYQGEVKASVESLPAKVSLTGLSDYYILDTAGNVGIEWNIENFAKFSSSNATELFEMSIAKNGAEIYKTNDPGTGDGQGNYRGTYTLGSLGFSASSTDKNGYRQVYTVSVKAKNGTSGTWSYDSFLLYVYDEAALKIWIQPTANDAEKNGKATGTVITGSGSTESTLMMDNGPVISNMSQDAILALKGDISLRNVISANYGEYAWTELSDQLAWASDNNAAVSINYRQGSLYEDIRKLSNDSYRPGTDLLLSGIRDTDKPVTVTAEHVLTGMKDSLAVSVKTLKNRLYLFRCYPQTTTTLTYYDKNGDRHDVVSDASGEAAIYEEDGIWGDVYCRSVIDEGLSTQEEYLATIHNSDLKTGEGDSTKLELYPYNLVTLRRAAYAYVYLKNPDGTPYTGSVILRGAVYVNDEIVKGHVLSESYSADIDQIQKGECFTVLNTSGGYSTNWISFKGAQFRTPKLEAMNGYNIAYDELSFGYKDNYLEPNMPDGALKITMDVSQWELKDSEGNQRALSGSDKVKYVFTISAADSSTHEEIVGYYPIFLEIDANATEDNYVKSGDSIVTFRQNKKNTKHPFIVGQKTVALSNGHTTNVIDYTGRIGVSDSNPEGSVLETVVMWWGEEKDTFNDYSLQLYTSDGKEVAYDYLTSELDTNNWIFARDVLTKYDVTLTADSIKSCIGQGQKKNLYLEYKRKNYEPITRREDLPFALANLIGVGKTEESADLASALKNAGKSVGTNSSTATGANDQGDEFVGPALRLLANMEFTDSEDALLSMNITPTNDPTKFLGLMSFSYSTMDDNEVKDTGVELNLLPGEGSDFGYTPAIEDLPWGGASKWLNSQKADLTDAMDNIVKSDVDITYEIGGYMETLIYWDFDNEKWAMTVLDGGFNAGGGLGFKWDWNMWVGPVPITMEVELGGTVRVSMDAITTAYQNNTTDSLDLANEYLTKLRLYLYVKVFAGVGIDYSVVALKLGIFGQISLDMTFEWLNRPYLKEHMGEDVKKLAAPGYGTWQDPNLNGQRFRIDGMIGLEFVASVACIEYEKVLYSINFNMMDQKTGYYNDIEELWKRNQENLRNAIDALTRTGSMQVNRFGGESLLTLDLAPRAESRDYLNNTETKRTWGNNTGAAVARTAQVTSANALRGIETNTYPYAAPKIVNGGDKIIYLSDMNSADINATRAVYATKNGDTYVGENSAGKVLYGGTPGIDAGYGDTQLDTDYDGSLTVATWVRRMVDNGKFAGQTLSNIDQMVSLNGTEIFASVFNGVGDPATTRLTNNTGADVAPTAATRNGKAMVAWRSVAVDESAGGTINIADFNKKDTIKCRFYDGSAWSNETYTVYNGSSGNVKGLDCAMLTDGTAAIAYTLDTDGSDVTTDDREIVYAVINSDGTVVKNIRVTNNARLDENPAIEAVTVDGQEEFVLAWYSSEVQAQESGATKSSSADICLVDFNGSGEVVGRIPGSLSQTAGGSGVNVTSNFSFVGGGHTLETLGIAWVERAQGNTKQINGEAGATPVTAADAPEYDVLKAVMFYDAQNGSTGVTSVVNVAEMPDGTLIDSFDTVIGTDTGKIEAVVLGTTYGSNGVVSKTGMTKNGQTITYSVPSAVSNLYRVTEVLENRLTVTSAHFDRSMVRNNSSMSVQYALRNDGIDKIKNISIKIGNEVTAYNNIGLMPGGVLVLRADHNTGSALEDSDWTVTAEFDKSGQTEQKSVSGRLMLDYPDIEVTSAKVVEEKDGKRKILIKLNNASDALLYKGYGNSRNRQVGISFYTDATLRNEIKGISSFVIDNGTELEMIDNGGYSKLVEFDVRTYLQGQSATTIPEAGIPIYVAANVLEYNAFTHDYESCPEPNVSNNSAMVSCDNLQARTGKDVVITNDMEIRNGQTIVTVDIQNASLASTTTGNLIVSLKNEAGEVIEQKQSYTGSTSRTGMNAGAAVMKTGYVSSYGAYLMLTGSANGLITLGGEETATETFTFNQIGYSVDVAYTNLKLDSDNTELGSLNISEIGINEKSFKADGTGRFVAEAKINKEDIGGDIVSTVIASAKSPYSTVKVTADNGTSSQTGNLINDRFTLVRREMPTHGSTVQPDPQILIRKLTVTVTADSGKTAEYVVNITYVEPTQPVPGPTPGPTPGPSVTPSQETEPAEEPAPEEKKEEKVKPVKAPAAERKANAVKLDKKIGATQKNGKLSFTWGKVKDAEYYNVYVAYYGDPFEKTEPVTVEDATKFSTKKIGGKKIDQTKNLKFKVVAMKTEDGKPVMLGESLTLYVAGAKNAEYTNVALIKLSKTKKTLTLGKTFKIKADVKLEDEKKKMLFSSAADLRYESTDTSVAKVSSSGKITAVGKGTCYIRVHSLNGVTAKIKVTVE